jgi:hypothetical protein
MGADAVGSVEVELELVDQDQGSRAAVQGLQVEQVGWNQRRYN